MEPDPRLAGRPVVVVGADGEQVAAAVAALEARGARACAFVGDATTEPGADALVDAVAEMSAELFPARPGDDA